MGAAVVGWAPQMVNMSEARPSGERRFVTIVFADVCDYTALTEQIEPEHVEAVRARVSALAAQTAQKYGGVLTQVSGDGQLCVFGYPEVHEDDVRRAIDAGLELHALVRETTWQHLPEGFELRLHTGIHAGLIFLSSGTAVEGRYSLTGDAVNTASRLCTAAQRDEILVSDSTLRSHDQFFDSVELPQMVLKGKAQPVVAHRVTGRSGVRTRFDASRRRGLTLFVDRRDELAGLLSGMRAAMSGRGQFIIVSGTAGIGKTRLLEEFNRCAAQVGVQVLLGTCDSYGELTPLEPFRQILSHIFGLAPTTPAARASHLLERACAQYGPQVVAHLDTYRSLLGLTGTDVRARPGAQQAHALESLFKAVAAQRTLTLILDDWQWADDASRTVLHQLQGLAQELGFCIVLGVRGGASEDPRLRVDRVLQLCPLEEEDCNRMISTLIPVGSELSYAALVLMRSGGNPLFVEELCRSLPLAPSVMPKRALHLDVPATVQGVIQRRIAALPKAQAELLQLAAVIGMEFAAATILQLREEPECEVIDALDALAQQDLIYATSVANLYRFKHGLTRDVVYDSVLISVRRIWHARIAELLERDRGETSAVEALAYHHRGSDNHLKAAHYSELAGDRAMAVSALDRSRYHYVAAMSSLEALQMSNDNKRAWLALCNKWGLPFVYSPNREQLQILQRGLTYADELADGDAKAACWHWLGWAHYTLGDYSESIHCYRQALELLRSGVGNPRLHTQVVSGLGQSQAAASDYDSALISLEQGIAEKRAAANAQPGRKHRIAQGYAYALGSAALVRADQGDFERADREFDEALGMVETSDHAIYGSVLGLRCIALIWRGRWHEAYEASLRNLKNARLVTSAFNFAMSTCFGAYCAWRMSGAVEQAKPLRETVEWLRDQQLQLFASFNYSCLAQVLAAQGDFDEARRYASFALTRASARDRLGEAHAYRVLAELPTPAGLSRQSYEDACLSSAERAARARGSRHELATTQLRRAELLRAASDVPGARPLAEWALREFEVLGMNWHAERARLVLS